MRLLLISPLHVGERMTAGGIRYAELASHLRHEFDVVLAAPKGSEAVAPVSELHTYDPRRAKSLSGCIASVDAVFAQPMAPHLLAPLQRGNPRWVVDMLNPQPFEGLEFHKHRPRWERKAIEIYRADRLLWAARVGTAFACASERQRDMWLGYLAAARRLDTDLYETDPEMRLLVDVVPSGVPDAPPQQPPAPVLRGPIFPSDARILLWLGGIWDWFDPATAIRALSQLRQQDDRWVLAFSGTGPPAQGGSTKVEPLRALIASLGLADAVHLPSGWIPYSARDGFLLEADIAVWAHAPTLEARFAFRNRILDCLWAGLPMVCTRGDELGDTVESNGWGLGVPIGSAEAMANAALAVADNGRAWYRQALAKGANDFRWSASAERLGRLLLAKHSAGRPGLGFTSRLLHARHGMASLARDALDP